MDINELTEGVGVIIGTVLAALGGAVTLGVAVRLFLLTSGL